MSTVKKIKDLAQDLVQARLKCEELQVALEQAKADKETVQTTLLMTMEKGGLKSLKTDDYTFSAVVKADPRIVDEEALLADLDQRGLKDDVLVTKIDTYKVKSIASGLLKETGEVLNGTEIVESAYMSIRKNK